MFKLKDILLIIVFIIIVILGTLTYSERIEKINNGEFAVISDSEIDK